MPTVRGANLWRALLLPVFVAAATLLPPAPVRGASQPVSSWLKPEAPVFNTIRATIPPDALPIYTYKDCSPHTKFVTIPKNILKAQPEVSYETCTVQTAFGQASVSDGNVRLSETSLAGSVKASTGGAKLITPIPSSNHVMTASGALYGAYRFIIKDFAQNITTEVQPNGSIIHKLKPGVTEVGVKNTASELLDFADPRFSDNGKWMIADVPQRGMTRVNIETGETLVFGPPFNYSVGVRPLFISAISGDGRYALVAATSYGILKIYDLSTCVLNNDQTRQAACQTRDLLATTGARFSNFEGIYHAQFSTDYSLQLYLRYSGTYGYFTLTAAGEAESQLEYLATGDSFASGEGTFNYKQGTNVRSPFNGCHLSLTSYPFLLPTKTNLNSVQSVACSGARNRDIVNSNYTEDLAQAKGKNSPAEDTQILSSYLVGYRPQINFVEATKPANLTVSIGGNDIGFGKILLACLGTGTCYTDPQERLNLIYTINQQYSQLVNTYENLRRGANTNAHIYVLGYPLLADAGGNCALNVHLNQQEIVLANQIVTYLNSVIKQAAQKAGVSYINIEQALVGHRLCETNSANIAVNGLTAGDDKTFSLPIGSNYTVDGYFTGQESYHPNQLGHNLLGQAISAATNNFSTSTPDPATVPDPTELTGNGILPLANGANLTARKIIFTDSLTQSAVVPGQASQLHGTGLQQNTSAMLRLSPQTNAAPTTIGAFQTGAAGQIEATFTAPASLQPGIYVVHLEAKNKAGEDLDIQKVIYVAQSPANIDGDTTPNDQEKCLLAEPANTDIDLDGIDDACDPLISDPPITPASAFFTLSPTDSATALPLLQPNPAKLLSATTLTPAPQPATLLAAATAPKQKPADPPGDLQTPTSGSSSPNEASRVLGLTLGPGLNPLAANTTSENSSSVNPLLALIAAVTLGLSILYLVRNKWQKGH